MSWTSIIPSRPIKADDRRDRDNFNDGGNSVGTNIPNSTYSNGYHNGRNDNVSNNGNGVPRSTQSGESEQIGRIFALSPVPTIVLNSRLQIIQVSDSYLRFAHYTRKDCLGRSIHDLPPSKIPAPDSPTVGRGLAAAIATRAVQVLDEVEIEVDSDIDVHINHNVDTNGNGNIKPNITVCSVRIVPIFDGDDLLYVTIVAHDIAHKRPPRTNYRDQLYVNETYRVLVDTVKNYAIFMLDTTGHVATWNSGAAILKGYSAEEIIGRHFSIFYGDDDRHANKPQKELQLCLREGRVEDEGWRYRKDGSRFWANVMITPVYQGGHHFGFAKITRDLTERKAAEARLIAAFDESSKMKSEFLANMSHEIRTPMHGMLLAITMLNGTNLDERQREYASIIEDTGSLLLRIINDVLDYSKFSSGSFSITADVLSVKEVISAVVRSFRPSVKPGVELESILQPGFPNHLRGDPVRYRQILQNLVGNAVKFTEQGHIKICTTLTEPKDPASYEILTEVIDTGIGVPDGAINTLFTPFTRFADSASKRYQGTGLGLSICKSLAELMDGAVGYHPNPDGQGSVFWLTARMRKIDQMQQETPPCQSQMPSPDPSAEIKVVAPGKQLLLVEDNIMNQTIMLKLLNVIGFDRVDTAWDGAEAVRLVRQKPLSYNTILMDINMPIMDGVEATAAIREFNRDVPIIAMTGNALRGDAETYLARGMNDYIAKPVHRQHLIRVLLRWIGP